MHRLFISEPERRLSSTVVGISSQRPVHHYVCVPSKRRRVQGVGMVHGNLLIQRTLWIDVPWPLEYVHSQRLGAFYVGSR